MADIYLIVEGFVAGKPILYVGRFQVQRRFRRSTRITAEHGHQSLIYNLGEKYKYPFLTYLSASLPPAPIYKSVFQTIIITNPSEYSICFVF